MKPLHKNYPLKFTRLVLVWYKIQFDDLKHVHLTKSQNSLSSLTQLVGIRRVTVEWKKSFLKAIWKLFKHKTVFSVWNIKQWVRQCDSHWVCISMSIVGGRGVKRVLSKRRDGSTLQLKDLRTVRITMHCYSLCSQWV